MTSPVLLNVLNQGQISFHSFGLTSVLSCLPCPPFSRRKSPRSLATACARSQYQSEDGLGSKKHGHPVQPLKEVLLLSTANPALVVNAPSLAPMVKHQTILKMFDALPVGYAALLVNDHDPKPLLYQLEAEQPGVFSIAYQESGPSRFAILVTKNS